MRSPGGCATRWPVSAARSSSRHLGWCSRSRRTSTPSVTAGCCRVREGDHHPGAAGRAGRFGLGARLTGRLALLAASMRAGGVRVGVGELIAAHRALAAVDPSDRDAAYFAPRTTLFSRHDDLPAFDAAFAEWFALP